MKEIQVGKVMLTFKGEYDSTKTYTRLDAVIYQGSSYVCLSDTSSTPPGDNWQLLAQKGSDASVDLTPYAKKADLNGLAKTRDIPSLNGYAKLTDIPSLDGYAKTSVFDNYYNKTETDEKLADKADKSELPDLSGYAKKSDIPSAVDLTGYAKKSDIPSLDGYAKLTDIPSITGLVKETELADYAKKSDIPTIPDLSGYAKKSDIPAAPDLSPYAKIADLASYATSAAVQKAQSTADSASKMAHNNATLIQQVSNKVDTIKMPDLSGYAKSADVNTQINSLKNQVNSSNQVKTITSGTLADLANKKGSYHYEIDCSPGDSPVADWGLCDVVVGDHYAKQTFTNTGNKSGDSYLRIRDYGGNWSDWREVTLWQ